MTADAGLSGTAPSIPLPSLTGHRPEPPNALPEADFWLPKLCSRSSAFLLDVVRAGDGLFPYSTRLRGGAYANDFEHPAAPRYTINSLLGLQTAARESSDVDQDDVDRLTRTFLASHGARVATPADLGLLLVLLAEANGFSRDAKDTLARVRRVSRGAEVERLTMQDVSWMLWGACAAADAGLRDAAAVAAELGELILTRFVHPESLFPRHDLSRYRRDIVSFGALTYFLRAMYELFSLTDDPRAARAFTEGVGAAARLQGDLGEWPWLISARRRIPLDFYPVFAVHQDSMSMLFLLPALELGLPVAGEIERSFAWVLGRNELSTPMVATDPFVAYRSIERVERWPRARRYARSLPRSATGAADRSGRSSRVRINPECRSYHLGWLLYVWSGRARMPSTAGDAGRTPRVKTTRSTG